MTNTSPTPTRKASGHSPASPLLRLAAVALLSAIGWIAVMAGDTVSTRFEIAFPINSHKVLRSFGSNGSALDSIESMLSDRRNNVCRIEISGAASPDGPYRENINLARRRMDAIRDYVKIRCGVTDSVITLTGASVPWQEFRDMLAHTGDRRLTAIASEGSDTSHVDAAARMNRLKALDNGKVWDRLKSDILPRLRKSTVLTLVITGFPGIRSPEEWDSSGDDEPAPQPIVDTIPWSAAPQAAVPACHRSWHLSSSLLGLSLGIINATGEIDFACHWSAALSVYYSGWNYARHTRKFRTFIFRPEVRYWFSGTHSGLFVDAHMQMAAYNFALPGWEYRIQDVDGRHPALGGGIGIGYRLPLGRNGRWAAEAAIGAGIYHLEYDKFVNERNGRWVSRHTRTFVGIDNVAISLVYNFNAFNR